MQRQNLYSLDGFTFMYNRSSINLSKPFPKFPAQLKGQQAYRKTHNNQQVVRSQAETEKLALDNNSDSSNQEQQSEQQQQEQTINGSNLDLKSSEQSSEQSESKDQQIDTQSQPPVVGNNIQQSSESTNTTQDLSLLSDLNTQSQNHDITSSPSQVEDQSASASTSVQDSGAALQGFSAETLSQSENVQQAPSPEAFTPQQPSEGAQAFQEKPAIESTFDHLSKESQPNSSSENQVSESSSENQISESSSENQISESSLENQTSESSPENQISESSSENKNIESSAETQTRESPSESISNLPNIERNQRLIDSDHNLVTDEGPDVSVQTPIQQIVARPDFTDTKDIEGDFKEVVAKELDERRKSYGRGDREQRSKDGRGRGEGGNGSREGGRGRREGRRGGKDSKGDRKGEQKGGRGERGGSNGQRRNGNSRSGSSDTQIRSQKKGNKEQLTVQAQETLSRITKSPNPISLQKIMTDQNYIFSYKKYPTVFITALFSRLADMISKARGASERNGMSQQQMITQSLNFINGDINKHAQQHLHKFETSDLNKIVWCYTTLNDVPYKEIQSILPLLLNTLKEIFERIQGNKVNTLTEISQTTYICSRLNVRFTLQQAFLNQLCSCCQKFYKQLDSHRAEDMELFIIFFYAISVNAVSGYPVMEQLWTYAENYFTFTAKIFSLEQFILVLTSFARFKRMTPNTNNLSDKSKSTLVTALQICLDNRVNFEEVGPDQVFRIAWSLRYLDIDLKEDSNIMRFLRKGIQVKGQGLSPADKERLDSYYDNIQKTEKDPFEEFKVESDGSYGLEYFIMYVA